MSGMRYNKDFKSGIVAISFCILLFGTIITFFVAHSIQYKRLTADMLSVEATIIDIDFDAHLKGPNEQEIYVE